MIRILFFYPFSNPNPGSTFDSHLLGVNKGALKKVARTATKKKGGGGGGSAAPELCEVCLRLSAISADVTHAVGVADLAPATEARLFAPFAVVVAVLAPEARLFAPFGLLNLFL